MAYVGYILFKSRHASDIQRTTGIVTESIVKNGCAGNSDFPMITVGNRFVKICCSIGIDFGILFVINGTIKSGCVVAGYLGIIIVGYVSPYCRRASSGRKAEKRVKER